MKKLFLNFLFFIFLMASVFSCSDVRLKNLDNPQLSVKSYGQFCVSDPDEIQRLMKFLFVIDKSGSNTQSDNGGKKRSNNIEDFVRGNGDKNFYRYSMIVFEGDKGAQAYIHDNSNDQMPIFTDDVKKVFAATKRIRDEQEGGSTPYKAALQAAKMAIKNDLRRFPKDLSTYMVFFVSDGQPTDTNRDQELKDVIDEIVNLAPNIYLSTAYYGSAGDTAIERLRRMGEQWGKGKFVNFELSKKWDFNELTVKPTHEPWQLKNFLVYNLNAGYCEDGKVDVDSDMDGMCDRDEIRYDGIKVGNKVYHFDPTNRFSNGGAFGDYFYWRELRYGEVIPTSDECNDKLDEDHDFLTNCEEKYIWNERPSANVPKHGDPLNPDTDRDGVLDGIETFVYFTHSLAYAMDSFNLLNTNLDGEEQAGVQIAQHRNPLIKDPQQNKYDTHLEKLFNSNYPNKDCYFFSQKTLPLYSTLEVKKGQTLEGLEHLAGENNILVYYIQTPQRDPQGDGVYMYSIQKLKNNRARAAILEEEAGLKVDDSVFESYVIPSSRSDNHEK